MTLKIDYDKVQAMAARRLSIPEICAVLDYDIDEFKKLRETDKKLKTAIKKGTAQGVLRCSETVMKAIDGKLADAQGKVGRKEELQVKAAFEFLDRHGEGWQK